MIGHISRMISTLLTELDGQNRATYSASVPGELLSPVDLATQLRLCNRGYTGDRPAADWILGILILSRVRCQDLAIDGLLNR